jgi:exocyst complex component 8
MSLRKRPDGSKTTQGAQPRPQQRSEKGVKNAPKSRVDDRIKKRMTMRYADISQPSQLSIPSLPPFPADTIPEVSIRGRDERLLVESPTAQGDPRRADVKAMEQENFDPEACKLVLIELAHGMNIFSTIY